MPRLGNLALEPPRPEIINSIRKPTRKTVRFQRGAQIRESGPGAAQAGKQQFHKETYKEDGRVPEGFQKPFQKEFQKGPRRSSRRVPEGSQKDSRRRSRRVPEASQKEFQKGPRRVPEGSQKGSYGLLGHTRLKRSFQACFLHFAIFPTSSCFWWPCSGVSFRLRGAFCG